MPIIFPTKACNLRCKHCLRADFPEGDIDLKMMRDFMYDMEILEGFKFHTLTGGEPTLHKNFDELLGVFKSMNHRLSIVTNAQLSSGIESLIKYKKSVNYVNISFDSPLREDNDKVRGKGTFNKALESLHTLQSNGISVTPIFVIHNNNGHLIDEIFSFVKTHRTNGALIIGLHTVKRAIENNLKHGENSYNALKRFYELRNQNTNITFNSRNHIGYLNPEWSSSFCNVMEPTLKDSALTPDGNLWVCCDFVDLSNPILEDEFLQEIKSPIIGNIKEDSLNLILERKKRHTIEIKEMRFKDSVEGNLVNGREMICDNCKYYHFHKT